MQTILTVIHIIIGLLLILMILLQSGSDELKGLSGGAGNVMSPAASANFMTKLTAIFAALFIINCLALANVSSRESRISVADKISKTQKEIQAEDKALPVAN